MTSDRGTTGEAEMQLSNSVTPKAPTSLNPNANVFQINKSPATSPDSATQEPVWQQSEVETHNNVASPPDTSAEGYTYMNGVGDAGRVKVQGGGVSYPATPESDPQQLQLADYQNLNGGVNNEVLYAGSDAGEDHVPLDGTIPEDQLRAMLKSQLEYYFSIDNLSHDSYLVSQMDPDQFVPISTIAKFNQVKKLTTSIDLVIEVLRESSHVQVDEKGEKVRPLHKRCIVILREVPESTPQEEVEKLFSGPKCPKFISCEYAGNSSCWYVTFDNDEDAQRAYQYLREDVKNFLGKPIMARIKAKPLRHSSTFVPKNGFKPPGGFAPPPPHSQRADAQPSPQATVTYSQQAPQTPPQTQTLPPQRGGAGGAGGAGFSYTTPVPSIPYQQVGNETIPSSAIYGTNFPFFPPNAVMHAWPTNTLPFYDPGTMISKLAQKVATPNHFHTLDAINAQELMQQFKSQQHHTRERQAFAANGYTLTGAYKPHNNTSRQPFQGNMRGGGGGNRNQNRSHMRGPPMGDHRDSINSRPPPPPRLAAAAQNHHHHHNHHPHHHNSHSSHHIDQAQQQQAPLQQHRSSPRNNHDNMAASPSQGQGRRDSNHGGSPQSVHSQSSYENGSSSMGPGMGGGRLLPDASSSSPGLKDQSGSQSQRYGGDRRQNYTPYRSRRRHTDDGAKASSINPRSPDPASFHRNVSQAAQAAKGGAHMDSPKFDLESNSFPPLPGSTNSTTTGDIFENKMSDVVKGTAKPLTREPKPQTPPSSTTTTTTSAPASSSSSPNKDTAAMNGTIPQPTPPSTPHKVSKATSTSTEAGEQAAQPPSKSEPAVSTAPATITTSTQTQNQQTKPQPKTEDKENDKESASSIPAKLSYAQMAQRGKEKPPAAPTSTTATRPKSQEGEGATPATNEKQANTSSTSKPQTLKEQSQTALNQSRDEAREQRNRKPPRDNKNWEPRRPRVHRNERDSEPPVVRQSSK